MRSKTLHRALAVFIAVSLVFLIHYTFEEVVFKKERIKILERDLAKLAEISLDCSNASVVIRTLEGSNIVADIYCFRDGKEHKYIYVSWEGRTYLSENLSF